VLRRFLPFLDWFKGYSAAALRSDFVAGLTVALVLVPQSMAYAQLAGMPAYYGLYAAFLPPMVASLFGSSRQLATGPVAVVSLMTATALEPLATAGSESYVAYALLLALMVGAFQLLLGVLRLGLVVNFLSHPVVNGFTNAAALIIATSQLEKVFGVRPEKAAHHYETVWRVLVAAVHQTHLPTLGMAVLAFGIMIAVKRFYPRIPGVLAAVVLTTVLAWFTGFDRSDSARLAQIESPRVASLIGQFNQTVATKEELEALRTQGNKILEKMQHSPDEVCLRCHEAREVSRFTQAAEVPTAHHATDAAQPALLLHHRAGFLELQLGAFKDRIVAQRSELAGLTFRRTAAEPARFWVEGEAPAGIELQPGSWALSVGSKVLDSAKLRMTAGGAVVGLVPAGLPAFRVPRLDWSIAAKLLSTAMIISLLGFMEAISIAKAMAARTRQKIDPNQELIGQGLANLAGSLTQSYPVSGSFSRSAVALQAGARTGLGNLLSGIFVMVVLLFFSKTLYHLPQGVLAAIIMMAVVGLLNVSGFVHAWHTNRFDGIVVGATFLVTLFLAPHLEWGIATGVALSLGAYLYRTMRPLVVQLAPHPDGSLRDAQRHTLRQCRHIAVISFDGPLNFASASYLEDEILSRVAEQPDLKLVLIAAAGISEVDASGEETLRHVVERLRASNYQVVFSDVSDSVVDVLKRSHLYERVGAEHFYSTRAQAIAAVYARIHAGSSERDCPYRAAMPRVAELSLHPDGSLRDAQRHGLRLCRHIAAMRFDDPLTFANTALLEEEVLARLADRPKLRHVLFVAHGISGIDASGAEKLGELVGRLQKDGLAVSFSGLKEDVLSELAKAGVDRLIGAERMYPTQAMAIAAIYPQAHGASSEADCPLLSLAPSLTEVALYSDCTLRPARRYGLRLCKNIALLRLEGALVLSSSKAIQSEFIRWAKGRPNVKGVVFLVHTIHTMGSAEAENLLVLVGAVREAGYAVALAGLADAVLEALGRSGIADAIGVDSLYSDEALAFASMYSPLHAGAAEEDDCPLSRLLPRMSELSLHPDGSYRDASRHGLALCRYVIAVRFDGPLNYATIGYFTAELKDCLARRPDARHVLIAAHSLDRLDDVAVMEFAGWVTDLRKKGYVVVMSGLRDEVLEMLKRTGHHEAVGQDSLFPTQVKAIEAIHKVAHATGGEAVCPLLEAVQPLGQRVG
jgi:MFS superfamily sulfate permease-like transporter